MSGLWAVLATVGLTTGLTVLLVELPAAGQTSSEPAAPASLSVTGSLPGKIPLSPAVERDLREIQDQWVQWMGAFFRHQPEPSESLVTSLLHNVEQLGLKRLQDLSIGASARVVEAVARGSGIDDAAWALEAAERLDPGRPETAFAWALVRRQEGRRLAALWNELEGYRRLLTAAPGRHLASASLSLWAILALVLTAGLFVAIQMVAKGPSLFEDLEKLIDHGIGFPVLVLRGLAVILLLWPLVLPAGLLWLLLYWSGLLFVYLSLSERVVLVLCWALIATAPLAISWERRQVDLALSPAMRGIEAMAEGRLYGQLFQDLEHLSTLLPADPAVIQVMADLHRGLGQWDTALELYRRVLEVEPENAWARIDLGGYYFFKGDFGSARDEFRKAGEAAAAHSLKRETVVAYYNLSQAYVYSDSPLFDDAQRELQRAQEIDAGMVSRLQHETGEQRVVAFDGGVSRASEIRQRLATLFQEPAAREGNGGESAIGEEEGEAAAGEPGDQAEEEAGALSVGQLPGILGAVLVAMLFHLVRSRETAAGARVVGGTSVRDAFVPGLASARTGRGLRAFCGLLIPVTLLTLPVTDKLTYPFLPLYGATGSGLWTIALGGLIVLLGGRLVLARLG